MNGPASYPPSTVDRRLQPDWTTRLASIDEREIVGAGTRFWELTLYKTATGGYILESILGAGAVPCRPMAATLAFADATMLHDFLRAPESPSPLAEGLLERAAGLDPDLGPRRMP